MKQSKVERRKLYADMWHDLFRWTVAMFLIGVALTVAILNYFRISLFNLPLPLIILFFICLFICWVFMFRKRPVNKEFVGDK